MLKKLIVMVALLMTAGLVSDSMAQAQGSLPPTFSYAIDGEVLKTGLVDLDIVEEPAPCLLPREAEAKAELLDDGNVMLEFEVKGEASADVMDTNLEGFAKIEKFKLESKPDDEIFEVELEVEGIVQPSDTGEFQTLIQLQFDSSGG